MNARLLRALPTAALYLFAACGSDGTGPGNGLDVGQSLKVTGAQDVQLEGGTSGSSYIVVLANTDVDTTDAAKESYTLSGTGLGTPSLARAPIDVASFARLAASGATAGGAGAAPVPDRQFEARLRARERALLTPRIAGARGWYASNQKRLTSLSSADGARRFDVGRRDLALPASAQVGDTVIVNVNGLDACDNPTNHKARVVAIGTHATILADVNNPVNGFTDADYQRYATRFDTLVYPLDTDAFGAPTDIDGNGHVGLIFTSEVNKLTPPDQDSFVGGFTYSRDLFPLVDTPQAQGCPASNFGEFFYLMAPDPLGTINGNVRTAGFVDTNTTAVIAHEFQHLINASRRIYVNSADSFESTWLDEGLAHIAEELLFYRDAGDAPRSNLTAADIRATERVRGSFNLNMAGNAGRYRSYLLASSSSSPYASNDSLPTRGAAWSLLRYLADQTGSTDGTTFFKLVNSTTHGIANVTAVFGANFTTYVRDWSVSNAVDDVATSEVALQQPSWDWHDIYGAIYVNAPFPLQSQGMANTTPYTGTVRAGGATYFTVGVPTNGKATLTLAGKSSTTGSHLQLVVVRTR